MRMQRHHLMVVIVAAAVVAGGAVTAWRILARRPQGQQVLFSETVPEWSAARHNGQATAAPLLQRALQDARRWPAIESTLRQVDAAFPDVPRTMAAVARLNAAARDAGVPYHVDVQVVRERPILLTYVVVRASGWRLGDRSTEVLHVRRLDHLNIELGLAGHAGGDRPLVLLDRIEPEIIDNVTAAYGRAAAGNDTDAAARRHWRTLMEGPAPGAALSAAAVLLQARTEAFEKMQKRMLRPSVGRMLMPGRFELGATYFDEMTDFADPGRPGGALVFAADLRELERADTALHDGTVRQALQSSLDIASRMIEAHEARHVLDPLPRTAPPLLAEATAGLSPDFVSSAEQELRAFVAQIADSEAPPCLSVARLALDVRGSQARPTPHFYAGWTLLRAMTGDLPDARRTPKLLDALCALPDPTLRARAADAYAQIYGEPFVHAIRVVTAVQPGRS